MFSQRDIVLVQFPFTDLSGSKLRPALIIPGKEVNSIHEFVCIQITSKIFSDNFFLLLNDLDVFTPLKLTSGIRLHKFFTVNESLVNRKISELKSESFQKVMENISDKILKKD